MNDYLPSAREPCGRQDKPVTLMDLATIGAKALKKRRACSTIWTSPRRSTPAPSRSRWTWTARREDWLLHVQKRDPQPSHRDRALRRRGHLPGRRHPRPAVRPRLCLSGHARHRRGRPADARSTRPCPASCPSARSSPTAAAGYSSYGNQIGLATGHGGRDLPPRLCGQAHGDRRRHRRGPGGQCASASARSRATW